jgi:hypothetical protein
MAMEKGNKKKKSNKEIAVSIVFDNVLLDQNAKRLRESISQEGQDPDKVLNEYKEKITKIRKRVEEEKKKAKINKKFRPRL